MKKNIYTLSLIFLITSCNESRRTDTTPIREMSAVEQNQSSASKEKKTIFQEMGIEFIGDKIIIDMNKTDNFFGTLDKRIESKIEREIEKVDINISRDLGIAIEEEKINIDLNKTKNMLDNISHIFENILFESNSTKF